MTISDAFERAAFALSAEPAFAGVQIVEHKSRRHGATCELPLVIDRPAGDVDLTTCEQIAARINRALDACAEPYTLQVESAGLDRRLRQPADYDRFRGQAVRIKSSLPIDGRKTHRGTLLGIDACDGGSAVIMRIGAAESPIPLELIESANVEFDIRADLTRAKRERKARKCL